MDRTPALMEGEIEFYQFNYMLTAARTALDAAVDTATRELPGCIYHCISTVLFSAFAVEAALNHVGALIDSDWEDKKERMPWGTKLTHIQKALGFTFDHSKTPAKTLNEMFTVRDRLAHGRTWVGNICYFDNGKGREGADFPDWLRRYMNEAKATQVLADARMLIDQLFAKAGLDVNAIRRMSTGEFCEVHDQTRMSPKAVWKKKGT